MKENMKKLSAKLKTVFGWGMIVSLFGGGLTFFGYVAALIIGGDTAAAICHFIYKQYIPVLVYMTTLLVLLGIVAMYLNGELALTGGKKK